MKFITSSTEFFELQNNPKLIKLRESILAVPINNWKYINTLKFEPAREISKQEAQAITSHQIYLLENFDSISEINRNESLLNRYGYTPVSLTLEGAYLETLESLNSLNEGLADIGKSVKDFLLLMTGGGDALGILHFVLDIIGIIPGSWVGFPSDVIASLLNAAIYAFQKEPSYILAFINLAFAFSGPIGAGIKIAVKPFIKGAEKLFELVFKGASSPALKAGAMDFKAGALVIDKTAASSTGIIPNLGGILKSIGTFILTTGLSILKSLISIISKSIKFVTLGKVKIPAGAVGWIDELIIKMTSAGKAATEAGELLVKEDLALITKAEATAAVGSQAAIAAGKDLTTATRISTELEIRGFSATLEKGIKATDEWATFMKGAPNAGLQTVYLKSAVTEKLIGSVLNSKSAGSLINLMKSPEISAELIAKGWRPGEAALVDALKAGDSATLSKLFKEMTESPVIMEHIIAKERSVAKILSIFKESPEALIAGTNSLKAIQKTLIKLSGYRGLSLKVLIGFILKQCIKGNDCAKLLFTGSPDELLSYVSKTATGEINPNLISSMNELLSKIVINEDSDPISGASAADLEKFKTTNPEAYDLLSNQLNATNEAKSKLIKETKTNPCQTESAGAIAITGNVLQMNTAYQEGKILTKLLTAQDFKDAHITEYNQSLLRMIGENTNIDAQHPLNRADQIAYCADVFQYKPGSNDSILINETGTSNLDKVLDQLVADGKLNPGRREELKAETIKHWEGQTFPKSFELSDFNLDESFFKIGKLITRR